MDYKTELKIDAVIASALLTSPIWNDGNLSVDSTSLIAIINLIQNAYSEYHINDDNLTLTQDKHLINQIVFESQDDCTFYIPKPYQLSDTIKNILGRKIIISDWLKSYINPNYELIDLLSTEEAKQRIKRK